MKRLLLLFLFICLFSSLYAANGSFNDPIIDSNMTWNEAMINVSSDCPPYIKNRQSLVEVIYYGYDKKIHRGQIVVDYRLAEDVQKVFALMLKIKFPIDHVIPISHKKYFNNGVWDDNISMADNNTSGFNYRKVPGKKNLSKHAYGFALDINPRDNPYITKTAVMPKGAVYDKSKPGTLYVNHPVVKEFIKLGWNWGGTWKSSKDYQHFQKVPSVKTKIPYQKNFSW